MIAYKKNVHPNEKLLYIYIYIFFFFGYDNKLLYNFYHFKYTVVKYDMLHKE